MGFGHGPACGYEVEAGAVPGHGPEYCALVTDIQLRGVMEGWEVAKKAREIDPEFPVVYLTGGYAAEWPSRGVPNSVLLTKPFAPAQLVSAVSQLLNASLPTAPTAQNAASVGGLNPVPVLAFLGAGLFRLSGLI
jgi:DNA-binding response OmpR family regulator